MSIRGLVAQLAAAVAFQLARYRRCRAIQSCRDFLVRLPSGMPLANRTPLVQRELLVMIPHRNTSYTGCCTSFVNPSPSPTLLRRRRWPGAPDEGRGARAARGCGPAIGV